MDKFPERLREARGAILQDKFAEMIGVSRASLSYYENGSRTPDIETLKRIHEVTGVSVYYLLGITDARNDELIAAQKDTGLDSCALQRMEENPLCVKVVNHLLGSPDVGELIRLAATIHDDRLAMPEDEPEGWDWFYPLVMKSLRDTQQKKLQDLIYRILCTPRKDDVPMGVNPAALPCNIRSNPQPEGGAADE